MKAVIAAIFGNMICFLIVTTVIDRKLMGKLVYTRSKGCGKEEFIVSRQNRIDFKGNPVIVMIRVQRDKNWLHYVPVVGFDERYIFIAESLEELVNYDGKLYNRRIKKEDFRKLWDTSMLRQPLYRNTFYVVSQHCF